MADLKKKKHVCQGHKMHIKKTVDKAKKCISALDGVNEEIEAELKGCKEILVEKLQVCKDLDEEVLSLSEDKDVEEEINISGEFSRLTKKCIIEINNALEKNVIQKSKPHEENTAEAVKPKLKDVVKLSKITTKNFDGKPVNWTSFWDSFIVTVHLNESLSKVQKFTYLLGLLEGMALDTVSRFTLSDANYDAAVNLLQEHYGNKQLIIRSHMELVKLEQIISNNFIFIV